MGLFFKKKKDSKLGLQVHLKRKQAGQRGGTPAHHHEGSGAHLRKEVEGQNS